MSFVSKKKWPFFHLLKKVSEGYRRVIFFFLLLIDQNTFCGLDLRIMLFITLCKARKPIQFPIIQPGISILVVYLPNSIVFTIRRYSFHLRSEELFYIGIFIDRVSSVKFTMYNPFNSQKSTLKRTCTKSHKTLVQFSYEVKWSNGIGRYTRGSIYAHDCMFLGERIFLCIGYFRFMCKCGGSESWYLVSKRQQLLVLYLHYKHFPPGISLFGIDRNQRSMK